MTRADMDRVRADFVNATRMALDAGFDMIELHCAHGYLLSSFITPLANQRADEYGGSIENRLRYPLEVFGAMRAAWPVDRPMSVRISATDWVEDGVTGDDAVVVARAFADAGVDIVHVSTGQTSVDARPVYGRMYQTPFSDQVRNELGIPTIAVGNITAAGSGQQHHRRRSRRSVCPGPSSPERPVLDSPRRRRTRLRGPVVAAAVSDRKEATRARAQQEGRRPDDPPTTLRLDGRGSRGDHHAEPARAQEPAHLRVLRRAHGHLPDADGGEGHPGPRPDRRRREFLLGRRCARDHRPTRRHARASATGTDCCASPA